jgi:condensin complex subunit 1
MDTINFDINDALKHYMSDPATISTPEADSNLVDCESDPESLTNSLINTVLNPIVDSVAENPDAITRSSCFDSLQFLLKCAPTSLIPPSSLHHSKDTTSELFHLSRSSSILPIHALSKIFDLVISGLSAEADIINNDLETDEQDIVAHHKQLLEVFGFLLQWTIAAVETKAAEKSTVAPAARGKGKAAKAKSTAKDANWDSSAQLQTALDVMSKVLKLKLGKIFLTTSERDTFIGLLTRPVYLVLESEQRVKSTAIRMHAFKVLCIAVKHHGHAYGEF